jgi:hypothetical protein
VRLKPFFSYFGAKWRLAPKYPPPLHRTIVELFAGSACYATSYADREVILVEKAIPDWGFLGGNPPPPGPPTRTAGLGPRPCVCGGSDLDGVLDCQGRICSKG